MSERTTEILTAFQFQEELRRVARLDARCVVENPLGAAVLQIQTHPTFTQSRLLTRILDALTYAQGDFRRAEVAALDTPTRRLVIALMDSLHAGTIAPTQWQEAVNAAHQAQSAACD